MTERYRPKIDWNFKIHVRHKGGKNVWIEDYQATTDNPEQYAKDLIDWFNKTRKPGEPIRELVMVIVSPAIPPKQHKWVKTNLVTKMTRSGGMSFDEVRCERCQITGRRYGLSARITRDAKYAAQKFAICT